MHTVPTEAPVASNLQDLLSQAIAQHQASQLQEASVLYRQVLQAEPDNVDALHLLGVLAYQIGKHELAVELIGKAIAGNPHNADFHCNLGPAYQALGRLEDAVGCYRAALALQPAHVLALNNLGAALKDLGQPVEAIVYFRQALAAAPDSVLAQRNLAAVLAEQAQQPDRAPFDDSGPAIYFAEALRFAEQFEAPLKAGWRVHTNPAEPEKRIRLGYVSGDFRNHAVAYFIEPILANHDKSRFEVFCYSNSHTVDGVTDRLRPMADHWIACKDMSDDALATRIRGDGIDVLIDLSGHTAHNRLLVFARKPAPVQATWIGIPATTGLAAMDYRITDAFLDPPGMTDDFHTETLIRLPTGAAYEAPAGSPAVNSLPALESPWFTLACLNNLAKIGPEVIAVWARILHLLPHARLMLGNARNLQTRTRLLEQFARHGIAAKRIALQPALPLHDYLALHHQIDLALDPFPYNGGTTTNHSLWMGVPVVTLAGNAAISRVGVAALSRLGMMQFITHTKDEYVQRTLEYAHDLPRLQAVRQGLRARAQSGEHASAPVFAASVEEAFRGMWRRWCAEGRMT